MSTEQNKALTRQLIEQVFVAGNAAVVDEIVAEDFIENEELPPGMPDGREALKVMPAMMREAFPDFQMTIDDMIAEGDRVALRTTWSGTQEGEYMGIPASGKRFSVTVIDIMRFSEGRIVEHWGVMDSMGMMAQLGALPGMG